VIEVPSSFTRKKGMYSIGIEKDGKELALKIPINKVFTDPHSVHSLLTNEFGCPLFQRTPRKRMTTKMVPSTCKGRW
jgi:hypothetical protein